MKRKMERKKRRRRRKTRSKQVTPLCDMMVWFRWGEGRRPDVKQSEGHQRESDRWSENQRKVVTAAKEACGYMNKYKYIND